MQKVNTSAYHPQVDGLVEKFNGTLTTMISMYVSDDQDDWDQHLPYVLFAYRTSVHASTGCTPFFLLYGHEARFPIDVVLNPDLNPKLAVPEYIEIIKKRFEMAYIAAKTNIERAQHRQRQYYDQNVAKNAVRI